MDNTKQKLGVDKRFLGLAANSHHHKVKKGDPEKLHEQNTKIMRKIIALPSTVSLRENNQQYLLHKQLRSRKTHVEVAQKLMEYRQKLKDNQPTSYLSHS